MIVSASSGTTSHAIFSMTSREAFDNASRRSASPPSAAAWLSDTTERAGCRLDDGGGTARSGAGAEAGVSSTISSTSIGTSSSEGGAARRCNCSRGGCGGADRACIGGGLTIPGGRAAGGGGRAPGGAGRNPGELGGLAPGAGEGRAPGGIVPGGRESAAPAGRGAPVLGPGGRPGGAPAPGLMPGTVGDRGIVSVLPGAPAGCGGLDTGTGGREAGPPGRDGGGADVRGAAVPPGDVCGAAPDAAAAAAAGATATALGFARICFTCSTSFCESNGFGMCPFAPTAIALAGSTGVPPPRSSTGMWRIPASARTLSHNS